LVVNPENLESYGSAPSENQQTMSIASDAKSTQISLSNRVFLIFTTQYIIDNSQMLQVYINSLYNRGALNVSTSTVDGSGQSVATWIRYLVNYSYLYGGGANKVTDVVLIGNPDPDNGDVPMYNYYDARAGENVPTDWYYADVVSPSFPDYHAEVSVGRIPVYENNITELDKILTKSIAYVNQSGNNAEWRRFALLPAEPLGFAQSVGAPGMESYGHLEVINSLLKPNGWGTYRLYDPYDYHNGNLLTAIADMTVIPDELDCTYPKVGAAWKSLNPGLVVFNTHGDPFHAVDVLHPDDPTSVQSFNDNYPAMVYASSCLTSDPRQKNLGYQTLYYNAVNYTGATIEVAGSYANELGRLFVSSLNDDVNNPLSGDALVAAKDAFIEDIDRRHVLCAFNIYGIPDASMNINTLSTESTRLPAPNLTEVRVSSQDFKTKIKLVWQTVSGATGYVIERGSSSATRASGFQALATITSGSTTSYYDNNLPNGTKYKYRIFATNSSGRGGYSKIDSTTTYSSSGVSLYPSSAPQNITTTAHTNRMDISWSHPNPAPAYYIIQRARSTSSPFVTIGVIDSRGTWFTDRSVINGLTYVYRVAGMNDWGIGPFATSGSVMSSPNISTPTFTSVTLESNSSNNVRFNWQNNGEVPLFFKVQYNQRYPEQTWGPLWQSDKGFDRDASTATDNIGFDQNQSLQCTNFAGNVEYRFQMHSGTYNNSGVMQLSAPSNQIIYKTVNSQFPPPNPPGSFIAVTPPEGQLETINLEFSQLGDPAPEGWSLYRKMNGVWEYVWDIDNTGLSTISYDDQVGANVTCSYCLHAFRPDGNGGKIFSNFSNIVTKTSNAKQRTPNVSVYPFVGPTANSITLMIDHSSMSTTGIELYRSTNSINYTLVKTLTGEELRSLYADNNLSPSTTYYYKGRAIASGCTNSDYSGVVSATTLAPAATNIAIGKTSSASSEYSSTYNAAKGNDNSTTTRWRASSTSVPQWWKVDLGSNRSLVGSEVLWQEAGVVYKYRVEVSTNNSTWTTVADLTNYTNTNQTQIQNFTATARYVRLYVTALPSGKAASFYEFRVMGQ
jgi:hypothetical protein